jgi:predicted nucleic acid-binding protein
LIFVDTNILIDVATGNPAWADWSHQALTSAHARGPLLINAIVYAEFAIGFESQSDCDAEIERFDLTVAEMPVSAAFRATQAFRSYRRSGGVRASALPGFFIGAHASVEGAPLLTRDVRRYRAYFPELTLLAPEGA